MCGICGLLSPPGAAPVSRPVLEAMNETIVHRGPDSDGFHVDGPVGLAARRLSIIDLEGGTQPLTNEDGSVVVTQNGEIYNHAELREELHGRGHAFRTRSDTEVIAHAYEEWGAVEFAARLRGMFAVALWDAPRRRLVLARDRFGIKPLFWHRVGGERNGVIGWASELKALQAGPAAGREVDPEALEAFLAFNSIPAPLTIWKGVQKLRPGHVLIAEDGEVRIERFARPAPVASGAVRRESEAVLAEELRGRLRDSVRAHLIADVPVGVLLSGGVDSSVLAALAAQEGTGRVSTFSIGFKEKSFNELDLARLVARRYDTDHHELVVEPDATELFPKLIEAFDEPLADSSALPTFLVSQLASQHVKVVLSGEGGDELFGGYETYAADLLAPRLAPVAPLIGAIANRMPSANGRVPLDYKLKRFARGARLPALERHHAWKEIFSAEARALIKGSDTLMTSVIKVSDPLMMWRERYAETVGSDELARLQDIDLGIYLVDDLLVKTDRASMAHSLEARVPFLDTEVAELALALPTRMKVRGMQKKRLLRAAAEPLVPKEIVHGRKKGFSIPAAAWLRGPLVPFAREVLSPETLRRQGFLEPKAVHDVLDRHVAGREDLSRQLWGLLTFTLWHDRWA